ncbi:MAG: MBOAT family protein [Rhizobacter sp.]|nr:MBOAT family protein [Chlorobiales bacterium]
MLFNSFAFAIFFTVVTALYFVLPHRYRWAMLLAASFFFYAYWRVIYTLLLVFIILVDYFVGIAIENEPDARRKKIYLTLSIIVNLGTLFVFKYTSFLNESLRGLWNIFGATYPVGVLDILLPIGISFHTFQALSYTIEVYRGHAPAERHLGIYALYVMFYPQLVAGPIERPTNIIPQFRVEQTWDTERVADGLKRMGWGLFKKVVIADRLAEYVGIVYADPHSYTGLTLLLAAYFFAFQIYCDFSGYSDIALGAAKVMGFTLMENFNRPYLAKTITEFWRRWHISLSTWLRDYLYISLGGNRNGVMQTYINLSITMLLGGLWHGANWTFIVWGGLQAVYLIADRLLIGPREAFFGVIDRMSTSLSNALQILLTFHLTCLAWIFFRANSVADAFYIVRNIFTFKTENIRAGAYRGDVGLFVFAIALILFLVAIQLTQERQGALIPRFKAMPLALRWSIYLFVVFMIILWGVEGGSQFIYFQF